MTIPVIPPLSPEQKRERDAPPDPNPVVAKCGECQRDIHRHDNYCCGNAYCPLKGNVTC